MFAGIHLLIVACAALLAQAQLGRVCTDHKYGVTHGVTVHLPEFTIYLRESELKIPKSCPENVKHVGTLLRVCDAAPAQVQFSGVDAAVVRRAAGTAYPPASAKAIIYCRPRGGGLGGLTMQSQPRVVNVRRAV